MSLLKALAKGWREAADLWRLAAGIAADVNDRTGVLEAEIKIATLEECAEQVERIDETLVGRRLPGDPVWFGRN